jgi:hypothetical protein
MLVVLFHGDNVTESIMSSWFNHAFPIQGQLYVSYILSHGKFRPHNIEKAWEYLEHIFIICICAICTKSTPVRYQITDTTVDADLFLLENEGPGAPLFVCRFKQCRSTYCEGGVCHGYQC